MLQVFRGRRTERSRRAAARRGQAGPIERLEPRTLFSAAPAGAAAFESRVATLNWQGRDVEVVRDSWVVRMPQTNAATARNAADYRSLEPAVPAGWGVRNLGLGFFSIDAPGRPSAEVAGWAAAAGVAFHQPNFVERKAAEIPNEGLVNPPSNPGFGSLWGLKNTGQPGVLNKSPTANLTGPGTPGADIKVTNVWAEGFTGSQDVIVAVMDNGIDYTHADLQANMWTRPANVPADRYGLHGWDSAGGDGDVRSPNLTDAHGTHVAGTIGAQGNNGLGITGVMQEVLLYGAKVFGDGAGGATVGDQIDAISRIVDLRTTYGQNIVAINASLGGVGPENPARTEIIAAAGAAGILFVAAAGNSGSNNDLIPVFPANTPAANVISVAASNRQDELTSFSNFGRIVSIAAPGSGVWSTVPGDAYDEYPGTSMAAPHVAGVAGLIAAAHLEARGTLPTVAELKTAILEGAEVIDTVPGVSGLTNPTSRGFVNGNRRLDAFGALEILLGVEASVRVVRPSGREGNSGTTAVEFVIQLSKPVLQNPVTISYATVAGTATAGEDFTETSGSVVFQPGEQTKSVTVPVIGDPLLEGDESFTMVLEEAVNGRLGRARSAVYLIANDEPPLVTIRPAAVLEANGRRTDAVFEITVNGNAQNPVMVSYATQDGAATARQDYVPMQGMLVFLPGETRKTLAVKVIGDRLPEPDEDFVLVATARNGSLSADGTRIIEQILEVPGFIIDDDSRVVSVQPAETTVGGGAEAQFRVSLERIGGLGAVFPAAPPGLSLPSLTISATVGTVSQSPRRGLARALAGTDFTPTMQRLVFSSTVLEHVVRVATRPVESPRGFLLKIAAVEGAAIGTATAGAGILPPGGESATPTLSARPSARPVGRTPGLAWRGIFARR